MTNNETDNQPFFDDGLRETFMKSNPVFSSRSLHRHDEKPSFRAERWSFHPGWLSGWYRGWQKLPMYTGIISLSHEIRIPKKKTPPGFNSMECHCSTVWHIIDPQLRRLLEDTEESGDLKRMATWHDRICYPVILEDWFGARGSY